MARPNGFHGFPAIVFGLTLLFAACGSGSDATPPLPTGTSGSGSGAIFIGDEPPPGSTILKFEITLESATLCPTVGAGGECQGSPQPELIAEAVEIELKQLELETAFLNVVSLGEGTFEAVKLSFSNPELKILLDDGTLQELEAPGLGLDPAMLTPLFDTPLTVGPDTRFGFLVDFNLFDSIQTDSSGAITEISPVVSLVKLPAFADDEEGEIEELEDVTGEITSLQADCPTGSFTLVESMTGIAMENINFDNTSEFDAEDGLVFDCQALTNGMIVEVDAVLRAQANQQGTEFFAKEIEQVNPADEDELEGVVFQVDDADTFVLLVQEEEGVPNLAIGSFVTVDLLPPPNTEFRIDEDDLTVPASLSFASGNDLLVGQRVEVDVANSSLNIPTGSTCAEVSGPDGGCTATAEKLKLKEGTLTAEVGNLADPEFTLTNLPSLFGSDPGNLRRISADCQSCFVGSVLVSTSGQTEFRDDLSGVGDLTPGDVVTVRGLLFKNGFPGAEPPELLAERVRRRE